MVNNITCLRRKYSSCTNICSALI